MENVVRVLSTFALKGAIERLSGQYQTTTQARIAADFAPTLALLKRLREGEVTDVVILTREGLDELRSIAITHSLTWTRSCLYRTRMRMPLTAIPPKRRRTK